MQIVAGLILGVALGLTAPGFSEQSKIVGDAFINLIQLAIVPLILPLIILSIARMESTKALGRLAWKSLLYFEVVTTVIVVAAVGSAFLIGLGNGTDLSAEPAADVGNISKSIDANELILSIIPKNIFAALSAGNLLAILLFAVLLGVALAHSGPKGEPLLDVLDAIADAMFRIISWVVRLAPIAVASFVAYNVAHYGWGLLIDLAVFVVTFYGATLAVLLGVFPLVAFLFGVPYRKLLAATSDLVLLAFVTRSSEVVLAPLIARLDKFGVDRKISSFTVPLGYSFNADGATLYEGLAVVFLAHAYGIELTVPRLIAMILVLMLLTKGIAGIPSSSIVVLFSAASIIGLPAQGVAILLAVDFVVDMARTALNVVGNALAAVVVARSENAYHPEAEPVAARS